MKRKNYNEKSQAIINKANKLFLSQGFEKTTVDEIIKSLEISKGTFYHYFKSKEELLDAVINNFSELFIEKLKPIIETNDLDAIEKLNEYFKLNQNLKSLNKTIILETINVFYKDENLLYVKRLNKSLMTLLAPQLEKILEQGIKEDVLKISDSKEIAMLIVNLSFILRNRIIEELFNEIVDIKQIENCINTHQISLERILGLKNKSIIIFPPGYIKQFKKIR